MTLLVVYCLHYTPNPVFFHQVARWTTWPQRRGGGTMSWLHPQLTAVLTVYGSQLEKNGDIHSADAFLVIAAIVTISFESPPFTLRLLPIRETDSPPGRFSNPVCVRDHVTTPTRGWWKITSLQATGKWMVLTLYRIVQPSSVPAWGRHCLYRLYRVEKYSNLRREG